ncbi:MAG: sugar nucleotide-binding protein, partial [Clostridiaceae bacterium]|nr:sugar nucleotide-binding protein [Clostridiaceae bacterium]
MREKVFITGGSGLLALNWALTIRENYSVVLGLFDKDIYLTDVQVQYISLESVYDFIKVLETIQPSLVIHTAGLTNVETCEAYPDLAQHINVDLSINVAKACSNLKLPQIHISTDHLYSGNDSLIKETTPTSPLN